MYVYMYMYMYVCTYVHTYILIRAGVSASGRRYICVLCIYAYMCICVYTYYRYYIICMYVCIHVYVYVCMYVCTYMYLCMYVCMYVCIHVHTHATTPTPIPAPTPILSRGSPPTCFRTGAARPELQTVAVNRAPSRGAAPREGGRGGLEGIAHVAAGPGRAGPGRAGASARTPVKINLV